MRRLLKTRRTNTCLECGCQELAGTAQCPACGCMLDAVETDPAVAKTLLVLFLVVSLLALVALCLAPCIQGQISSFLEGVVTIRST